MATVQNRREYYALLLKERYDPKYGPPQEEPTDYEIELWIAALLQVQPKSSRV